MNNSPYFTVWFSPTKTINDVLSDEIKFSFHYPIIVLAISASFGDDISKEFGFGLFGSFLVLLLLTSLFYLIIAFFIPWWILKAGNLLKGKSKLKDLRIVFGLASIPFTLTLAYQLLSLSIGNYLNYEEVKYPIQFIVWIFYIRTLIIGIAKSQKFSYGFAIVNLFISSIPFIILKLIVE